MKELHPAPLSLFWYWMNERHAIYLRRMRGDPKPWTTDPILRDYKFTNVFRELDRGTVWLRENFLQPHADGPDDLLVFNIAWYRMFNWWGTGEYLGWQTPETWNPTRICLELKDALEAKKQVFTGAHIVYSTPGISKVACIVRVCDEIFKRRSEIAGIAKDTNSLEKTFNALTAFNCVGGFMAYEMVTDFRHTRLLENAKDIYTWANPGPGALRGLNRLGLITTKNREKAINEIRELQDKARNELPGSLIALSAHEIEMRDIEHSLCEFDKYCRVKFNEGEPRAKFPGVA